MLGVATLVILLAVLLGALGQHGEDKKREEELRELPRGSTYTVKKSKFVWHDKGAPFASTFKGDEYERTKQKPKGELPEEY